MDQSIRCWGSLLRQDHFCGHTVLACRVTQKRRADQLSLVLELTLLFAHYSSCGLQHVQNEFLDCRYDIVCIWYSGVMGVKLLGGSPIIGTPSHTFCLLVWDGCHVVGTTCNDRQSLHNTFGWMEVLQAPQQFHW